MLYTIDKKNVPGCPEGQTPILHLVSSAEAFEQAGIPYAFTDGHAIMTGYTEFYDDIAWIEHVIDWSLMKSRYWFDTDEYPNRKCHRQAEFLAYESVPWRLITEIGVINSQIQTQVQEILHIVNQRISVTIRSNWYY